MDPGLMKDQEYNRLEDILMNKSELALGLVSLAAVDLSTDHFLS